MFTFNPKIKLSKEYFTKVKRIRVVAKDETN